jgi:tetratricopeptide (TPR) repeat protein
VTSSVFIRPKPRFAVSLAAGFLGLAASAHAACNGPASLVASLKTHPTSEKAVALGSWYASHKQFACATETFTAALKNDPKSAQLHYLNGLALLAQRRSDAAQREVEESARLEPGVIKPHLLLASIYQDEGNQRGAEEQWRLALGIDRSSEPALEGLSTSLLSRQDYPNTIMLLRDAPRTERLAINLSRAFGQLGYLNDAERVLREGLQLHPDSVDLTKALTVVLVRMHRNAEAIKLVTDTANAHPGNIDEEIELFRVLVLLSQYEKARPMAPKLLAARPHDSEVLYLSGIIETEDGNPEQARTHLEEAVKLDPENNNAHYHLGVVEVQLHQWKEAVENLQQSIDLQIPLPEAHFELAKALRGLGQADRAAEEMKTYQRLKKAHEASQAAEAAVALADKNLDSGKTAEAIAKYREALESQPNDALYHYKLSVALRKAADTDGERTQLEEAIKLDPKLAAAHNELGFLLARAGDASAAVEHFRLAVQSAPAWTDAWVNLAAELAVLSRFSEARDAVSRALTLDPDNADARALSDQLSQDPAAQPKPAGSVPPS